MKTIIYVSVLFIVYCILYYVLDEDKGSPKPKKKCKTLYIRIKTPESIRTDYMTYSKLVDQFKPEKKFEKEHKEMGEGSSEWLHYF